MAWTAGVDRATGYLVTAAVWNGHHGATGNDELLKQHTHDGTDGDGATSLGPLVLEDFTDAAAPAAPGAGKTRLYSVSGKVRYRAGAAGADSAIAPDAYANDFAYAYFQQQWPFMEGVAGTGSVTQSEGRAAAIATGGTDGGYAAVALNLRYWAGPTMANIKYLTFQVAVDQITAMDIYLYANFTAVGTELTTIQNHLGVRFNPATNASWLVTAADGTTETTVDSAIDVATGTDYVINCTYDGTTFKAYINGVLAGTITTNLPTGSCARVTVGIGNNANANKSAYVGLIGIAYAL